MERRIEVRPVRKPQLDAGLLALGLLEIMRQIQEAESQAAAKAADKRKEVERG